MFDVATLLDSLKASPYQEITITAPHTGIVDLKNVAMQQKVTGPTGTWKEQPGTLLASITRERNTKPLHATLKGEICQIHTELDGTFVEAGTALIVLRHYLSKDEVLHILLKEALHLFLAPERAKYYFIPSIDTKVKVSGCSSITVTEGMELFIMSRMKRETPLYYHGTEGVIYSVYFQHNDNIDAGAPLLGICPKEQIKQIEEVVLKVHTDWQELG